jgi:hypothetical protein
MARSSCSRWRPRCSRVQWRVTASIARIAPLEVGEHQRHLTGVRAADTPRGRQAEHDHRDEQARDDADREWSARLPITVVIVVTGMVVVARGPRKVAVLHS